MKRLAIHKLRDRYFTPIFYTTYNAQFAHDYRLLCFQMYFRTRTGTMEPTKSHKVAPINHSTILHLSRSIGVNGYVRNRFWMPPLTNPYIFYLVNCRYDRSIIEDNNTQYYNLYLFSCSTANTNLHLDTLCQPRSELLL